MTLDEAVEQLEGTFIGENLKQTLSIYNRIEDHTQKFCRDNSISCPSGCGSCCEHFVPDVTQSEARMVALYMMLVRKDISLTHRLLSFTGEEGPCPLYDKDNPHHCQVYPARPLICRLFGACPSGNKEGKAEFRRCRFNPTDSMPEHLVLDDEMDMSDLALQLRTTDDSEVRLLPEAVSEAMQQLGFIISMLGIEGGDDGDHDGDHDSPTPAPLAS